MKILRFPPFLFPAQNDFILTQDVNKIIIDAILPNGQTVQLVLIEANVLDIVGKEEVLKFAAGGFKDLAVHFLYLLFMRFA